MTYLEITTEWRGLSVTGTYERDPGVWTWSNGDPGYPPCTEVQVYDIDLDDEWDDDYVPDALVDIADCVGLGAYRVACGACKVLGRLPEPVARWFKENRADELEDAVAEAADEHEPDYDDDTRYED